MAVGGQAKPRLRLWLWLAVEVEIAKYRVEDIDPSTDPSKIPSESLTMEATLLPNHYVTSCIYKPYMIQVWNL